MWYIYIWNTLYIYRYMVLTHNPTPFLFAWPAPMDQTPSCRLVTTAGCVMPRKTISSRLRSENGSPPFFRQSNLSWGCKVGTRPWILICPMGWFFSTQKRGRQHHTGKSYDGRCINFNSHPPKPNQDTRWQAQVPMRQGSCENGERPQAQQHVWI